MKNYSYSTDNEKQKDEKAGQFAYQLKDSAMRYMILQAGFLGILLLLSLSTLRDSNKCDGTQSECDKIRSSVSCKAQLVSPIAISFPIKNSSVVGASVAL